MATFHDLVKSLESDLEQEASWMPVPTVPGAAIPNQTPDPARLDAIVTLLRDNPILMEPTLNWLNKKVGQINGAMLGILYTPDELSEKRKQLEGESV